jgi:hypothetical protein
LEASCGLRGSVSHTDRAARSAEPHPLLRPAQTDGSGPLSAYGSRPSPAWYRPRQSALIPSPLSGRHPTEYRGRLTVLRLREPAEVLPGDHMDRPVDRVAITSFPEHLAVKQEQVLRRQPLARTVHNAHFEEIEASSGPRNRYQTAGVTLPCKAIGAENRERTLAHGEQPRGQRMSILDSGPSPASSAVPPRAD